MVQPEQTAVRPLTLERRRSRVPWIYLLYHRRRTPDRLPGRSETDQFS